MKIEKKHIMFWVIAGLLFIASIVFLRGTIFLFPFIIISLTISWIQFAIDFLVKQREQKQIEERFPDFVRNLVNAIKSGMPPPQSIIHIANRKYGALTPHVKKLASQIEWSVPMHKAMINFASSTDNHLIKRSIATVIEAERSGGNMEEVLTAITDSLMQIKILKDERAAHIHSQAVQSYIIFFVFMGVLIIIKNTLIPYLTLLQGSSLTGLAQSDVQVIESGIQNIGEVVQIEFTSAGAFISSIWEWLISLPGLFMILAAIQGLFTGLVIGKLSEGKIAAGVKHSLILVTLALLIMSLSMGVAG